MLQVLRSNEDIGHVMRVENNHTNFFDVAAVTCHECRQSDKSTDFHLNALKIAYHES